MSHFKLLIEFDVEMCHVFVNPCTLKTIFALKMTRWRAHFIIVLQTRLNFEDIVYFIAV